MKIKTIKHSMTRQVTNFHPASYEIEVEVGEGEDAEKVANELQLFTIKVLYKDVPTTRDALIKQLLGEAYIPAKEIKDPAPKQSSGTGNLNPGMPNF